MGLLWVWRATSRAVASLVSSNEIIRLREGFGARRRPLRTLGLLGDLHAERDRLQIALEVLRERAVDAIASVGDLADGDGDLVGCIALLAEHDVITVAGNHDRLLLADRSRDLPFSHTLAVLPPEVVDFCRALPPAIELATVAGAAVLCHGVGWDDMAVIDPATPDHVARWNVALTDLLEAEHIAWMLGGHTHQFMLRRLDQLGLVNPGTLSRREGPRAAIEPARAPGFLHIDFDARSVERFLFDGDGARIGVVETHGLP
jgi:predicted phosphodiesterase